MNWQEMSMNQLSAAAGRNAVAVLTVGATEQHGAHLPVGTDSMCAQHIARLAATIAEDAGTEVVLAPPVWWGYSRDHAGFPGTLTLSHATLTALLTELASSIVAAGFSRLLILNGHGSNDRLLYYVLRDVQDSMSAPCALAAVTYWKLASDLIARDRDSTPGGMAHACELETSLMLHAHPELVAMDRAVDERAQQYSAFRQQELLQSGPVMAPDFFRTLTESGVVGDPTLATEDKGNRWAVAIASRTAELIADLTTWPLTPKESTS